VKRKRLGFEQLVLIWILTPDDGSGDGEFRDYHVGERRHALHDWLQAQHHHEHRDVARLAACPGFKDDDWHLVPVLDIVPDEPRARAQFIARAAELTRRPSLVFLDPDNGMMTPSASGSMRCKFVDYHELATLLAAMHDDSALLVYQHLPRVKRQVFYAEALRRLREHAGVEHATWLSPDNAVTYFLMAKSDARLRDVALALEPYLELNRFRVPQ
jgi:hypothetical protein